MKIKFNAKWENFQSHIIGRTIAGFLALIPLLVTAIILLFIVDKIDLLIRPMAFVDGRPWDFKGFGVFVTIVAFYAVGLLISTGFGRRAIGWKSAIFRHIPVVKTIFGIAEQATSALTSPKGHSFSRVVFLEWPREGMIAMGFVTGHTLAHERDDPLVVVYIPTVPNPTSGNMAFVTEDKVMETDMSVEDAMKLIFSGGIVLPKDLNIKSKSQLPED